MNTALLEYMIARYNQLAYTHHYIYGFYFQNNVYMVEADSDIMPYILKIDKASRGQGYSLRFSPRKEQKVFLLSLGAKVLCSKEYFDTTVKNSKYNKGETFEKLVTESFGLKWKKDTTPFTKGADLVVNDKAFQLKFERATFTNEKILNKLRQNP